MRRTNQATGILLHKSISYDDMIQITKTHFHTCTTEQTPRGKKMRSHITRKMCQNVSTLALYKIDSTFYLKYFASFAGSDYNLPAMRNSKLVNTVCRLALTYYGYLWAYQESIVQICLRWLRNSVTGTEFIHQFSTI